MSKTTDGQSICHKAGSGTKTQPQRYGNSERIKKKREHKQRKDPKKREQNGKEEKKRQQTPEVL